MIYLVKLFYSAITHFYYTETYTQSRELVISGIFGIAYAKCDWLRLVAPTHTHIHNIHTIDIVYSDFGPFQCDKCEMSVEINFNFAPTKIYEKTTHTHETNQIRH